MKLTEFMDTLHYRFKDNTLLFEALCHSSFANEQNDTDVRDNERLEFLGDAVLNLVVGHILMRRFPKTNEGDLSRMRAGLVNEAQLAAIAKTLDLGSYLQLGKGELQTNGREKKSILADAFEAVLAAIYLDGGFDAAFNVIDTLFSPCIQAAKQESTHQDFKSRLQEFVQIEQRKMPSYKVTRESGPDHDKTFEIQIDVCGVSAVGIGKSKKTAEQDAARRALSLLKQPCCEEAATNDAV